MIRSVTSTLPTFKTVEFRPGLNVVVAEKGPDATARQTRNSAGKSTLVSIIDFLLGANCKPGSLFREEALAGHEFAMSFDLGGHRTSASRGGEKPNRIEVDGDFSNWPVCPKVEKAIGAHWLSNTHWRDVLGREMFGLPDFEGKHGPTFRSLISYFVRRQWSGGFQEAPVQSSKQQNWDVQVNLSFLLGLDWELSRRLQRVRLEEKSLETLKREAKSGVLGRLIGEAGELRTKLKVAESAAAKLEKEITEFRVIPEYRDLEREASAIAVRVSALTNENTLDRERVQTLERQLQDEAAPTLPDVEKMYQEADIVLPGLVVHRLDQVRKFHEVVVRNRRSHLAGEIGAARDRIEARHAEVREIDERRRELLGMLRNAGAIEQVDALRTELSRLQTDAGELRRRLDLVNKVAASETKLTIERAHLEQRIRDDLDEHDEVLGEAILKFEELSRRISEREGSLEVGVTNNGLTFEIKVEGKRSKGITNMQIFCFDVTLATLWASQGLGPGFLVHDSHLFDGMDGRQIGQALEIGAEQAEAHGFQYVVTLNSDVLATAEFSDGFDPTAFHVPVELTDETETGGLLGCRV